MMRRTKWLLATFLIALGGNQIVFANPPAISSEPATLVFPKLPLRDTTGIDLGPARNAGPFGEIIANVAAPSQRRAAAG